MMQNQFSTLIKVPLRKGWSLEQRDFSKWLASQEGLALLSDKIGLDLTLTQREAPVGKFSADLLCRDRATDKAIVIENQLSKSDHSHLGKLLTYAYNKDCEVGIWIAEEFNEEHLAVINRYNLLVGCLKLFAVEIALYTIDGSQLAPTFKIKAQPLNWMTTLNEWRFEGSDLKKLQMNYWKEFKAHCNELQYLCLPKPQAKHYLNLPLGVPGLSISAKIMAADETICVELYIDRRANVRLFDYLLENRNSIENGLETALEWPSKGTALPKQVILRRSSSSIYKESDWSLQHHWLSSKLKLFHGYFQTFCQEAVRDL